MNTEGPKTAQDYIKKGQTLLGLEKYQDAISCYDEAIKLDSIYSSAFLMKGSSLQALGKFEDAISCYESAIKLNPAHSLAFYSKGVCLMEIEKYADAISCYDQEIKLNPKYTDAFINKSYCLNQLKKYEEAISCLDEVIKTNPKDFTAIFNKSVCLQDMRKHEDAISCLDEAIKINPQDFMAFYNKSICLWEMKNYNDAISCLDEAIRVKPDHHLAYSRKGKFYQELGNDQMALDCFNKAYERIENVKLDELQKDKEALDHIHKTETEDRGALIKKLADLLKTTIEANKIAETLYLLDEKAVKIVKTFKQLIEKKNKMTSDIIDSFDKTSARNDTPNIAQIVEMQNQMESIMREIQEIQKTQEVQAKAAVKEDFSNLKQEDPRLYIYCKTFYWTALNLFGAYRSLSTDSDDSLKENLFVQGATKLTSFGAEIAKGVPFVESLIGALDSIIEDLYTSFRANKLNSKVDSINKVIQNKFTMGENISLSIAQLALAATKIKKQRICHPESIAPPKPDLIKGAQWLKDKIGAVKSKIIPSIDLHIIDDNSVMLALSDVTLIMAFLCKNFEDVIKNKKSLDVQCADIIENGYLEQMLAVTPRRSACCALF